MLVTSSDQHYMLWNHVWILFFYRAVYLAAANYFRSSFKLVLWAQHFVFMADWCKGWWQARGSNCISCKKIVSNYFVITHITYQKMTELQNYVWFNIVIFLRTMVFCYTYLAQVHELGLDLFSKHHNSYPFLDSSLLVGIKMCSGCRRLLPSACCHMRWGAQLRWAAREGWEEFFSTVCRWVGIATGG